MSANVEVFTTKRTRYGNWKYFGELVSYCCNIPKRKQKFCTCNDLIGSQTCKGSIGADFCGLGTAEMLLSSS